MYELPITSQFSVLKLITEYVINTDIFYTDQKSHFDYIYCHEIIIKMLRKMDTGPEKEKKKSQ